jgi:hypothetical protein
MQTKQLWATLSWSVVLSGCANSSSVTSNSEAADDRYGARWERLSDQAHQFEATRKEAAPYLKELVAAHNLFWGDVNRRCRSEAQDAGIRHFSAMAVIDRAGRITEFLPMPNSPHLRCYTTEMVGRVYPPPPITPFYERFEIGLREKKAE